MVDDTEEPGRHSSPLSAAVRDAVVGRRLLDPGDHLLVGVSGGPDSVALLHALALLRVRVPPPAHRLPRPPRAPPGSGPRCRLRRGAGGPVGVSRARRPGDVPRGVGRSPEEAARWCATPRSRASPRATGARRIALGHTADDQVETVFMRVLEGAGPRGLAGIPARRGRIVRPLLEVGRAAVLAHLVASRARGRRGRDEPRHAFLRNRVRHELLPLLAAQAGSHVPARSGAWPGPRAKPWRRSTRSSGPDSAGSSPRRPWAGGLRSPPCSSSRSAP